MMGARPMLQTFQLALVQTAITAQPLKMPGRGGALERFKSDPTEDDKSIYCTKTQYIK
jgi:hypothetical protein